MNSQTHSDAVHHDTSTDHLQWRIRGEYLEMPDLRLSLDQATRLLALDRTRCGNALDALVGANFLRRDRNGRYVQKGSGY